MTIHVYVLAVCPYCMVLKITSLLCAFPSICQMEMIIQVNNFSCEIIRALIQITLKREMDPFTHVNTVDSQTHTHTPDK